MHTHDRHLLLLAFVWVVSLQSGCIALSIPSERLHDPHDHGGLLGDWRHAADHDCEHPCRSLEPLAIDGGPLDLDGRDPALEINGKPKKDEVPWPRFHPVPTRPIFGGPASD